MAHSTNGELQQSGSTTLESDLENLIQRVHRAFVDAFDLSIVGNLEGEELRRQLRIAVEQVCDKVCHKEKTLLNRWEREMIVEAVLGYSMRVSALDRSKSCSKTRRTTLFWSKARGKCTYSEKSGSTGRMWSFATRSI